MSMGDPGGTRLMSCRSRCAQLLMKTGFSWNKASQTDRMVGFFLMAKTKKQNMFGSEHCNYNYYIL